MAIVGVASTEIESLSSLRCLLLCTVGRCHLAPVLDTVVAVTAKCFPTCEPNCDNQSYYWALR